MHTTPTTRLGAIINQHRQSTDAQPCSPALCRLLLRVCAMGIASLLLFVSLAPSLLYAHTHKPAVPRVAHIFIDFDGTIAVSEAFENLAAAAYASVKSSDPYPPWSYFSDTYNQEFEAFSDAFGPRTTLKRELEFQTSAGDRRVESDSFNRVGASGIFNQTRLANLLAAAETVQLRPGFFDLLAYASGEGIQPAVVSLNWSPSWIRLVLRQHARDARDRALLELVPIYCSEILPPVLVRPPNLINNRPTPLFTGGDKVALINKLAKASVLRGDVVFIGDSKADLPPLLLPPTTIGIVAAGSSSLSTALKTFGVKVVDVNGTDVISRTGKDHLLTLYSFADVVGKFRGPFGF
ncbi:hypothetical protein AURDEDRAFT_152676 [Auricularia subglabra TFB-10046 SS5]|nr:hypothetical protein AURDEDRAFT_152676 [Auricularia subglabra TFB-10046 SS5]